VPIESRDHAQDLFDRTWELYPRLMLEALELIDAGGAVLEEQDEGAASYFRHRPRAADEIDWQRPAKTIRDQIRGLSYPFRGAFTYLPGREVIVWRTEGIAPASGRERPGTLVDVRRTAVAVQAGDGVVWIDDCQTAGGGRMPGTALLAGSPVPTRFQDSP
jgi:methionyl-tRNA formyltransferase